MNPLNGHEAGVYFGSQWYLDQISARSKRFVRQGWITPFVISDVVRIVIPLPVAKVQYVH